MSAKWLNSVVWGVFGSAAILGAASLYWGGMPTHLPEVASAAEADSFESAEELLATAADQPVVVQSVAPVDSDSSPEALLAEASRVPFVTSTAEPERVAATTARPVPPQAPPQRYQRPNRPSAEPAAMPSHTPTTVASSAPSPAAGVPPVLLIPPVGPRTEVVPSLEPAAMPVAPPAKPAIQLAQFEQPTPTKAASASPTTLDLNAQLREIDRQIEAGEILPAHRTLSKLYWSRVADRPKFQERIDRTAGLIFQKPQPHFLDAYVIQPGDQLRSIAKKYNLSWEYLSRLNAVDPRRIQVGKRLKVVKGPFAAVVELQNYTLTIHLQGYYVERFSVGIGKDGASPVGTHTVLNKVTNPQYTDPEGKVIDGNDPQNPLGKRWIDLGNSYGIHGTIEPDSIGKAASRGCIRLRDDDVIRVYDYLVNNSEVEIRK